MRVIAGRLGGRRLSAPKGMATRPTSDRVREALFSMIGDVSGASVLDLYAGTGALGIEAISRGAARAVFVESARPALAALRKNLEDLDLSAHARVIAQPVERAIAGLAAEGPFDLILVDPPYAALSSAASSVSAILRRSLTLTDDGLLVFEHASRDEPPTIEGARRSSTRSYGEASLSLYERSHEGLSAQSIS